MHTTLTSDDGARARIAHHGAQLASWIPANQTEQLFLSAASPIDSGKALRGGVPVIFPQFSDHGSLPRHGFARNMVWQKRDSAVTNQVTFALRDDDITRAVWPHAFLAELTFTIVGNTLDMALAVHNTGKEAFEFTAALHTYLRVADMSTVRIIGLQGTTFRDAGKEYQEAKEAIQIDGHMDRIYINTASELEVRQPQQRVVISSAGFRDTVIWNPWKELSAAMGDMELDGYQRMVCVESAAIAQPVRLLSDEVWRASQSLKSERRTK